MKKLLLAGICLAMVACKKDPDPVTDPDSNPINNGTDGVFVTNEGGFQASNASVSFIRGNDVTNGLYTTMNSGQVLGDVLQDGEVDAKGRLWLAVNNSDKLIVTQPNSLAIDTVINGIDGPRFLVRTGSTMWLSHWGEDKVSTFTDSTQAMTGSYLTGGTGPEAMWQGQGRVAVCNSGGFGSDNTVSVLNATNGNHQGDAMAGDGPSDIVGVSNNEVVVLCRGSYGVDPLSSADDTRAFLARINTTSRIVVWRKAIGVMGDHPTRMAFDRLNNRVWVLNQNAVQTFDVVSGNVANANWIAGSFYGIGISPDGLTAYLADAKDFTGNGEVKRYQITAAGANLEKTFTVGVAPNGFVFRGN